MQTHAQTHMSMCTCYIQEHTSTPSSLEWERYRRFPPASELRALESPGICVSERGFPQLKAPLHLLSDLPGSQETDSWVSPLVQELFCRTELFPLAKKRYFLPEDSLKEVTLLDCRPLPGYPKWKGLGTRRPAVLMVPPLSLVREGLYTLWYSRALKGSQLPSSCTPGTAGKMKPPYSERQSIYLASGSSGEVF